VAAVIRQDLAGRKALRERGFRNRVSVLGSWIYGYVFLRRGSRLMTRTEAREAQKASRPLWNPQPATPNTEPCLTCDERSIFRAMTDRVRAETSVCPRARRPNGVSRGG